MEILKRLIPLWLKRLWFHTYNSNLVVLQQIWRGKYPPGQEKKHTLIEKLLFSPPLLIRAISLSNLEVYFIRDGRPAYSFIDIYVLLWVIALTIFLCFANQIAETARLIICVVVVYRILDILSTHFCILLIDSQKSNWAPGSFNRSLLLILLNFYEIVVVYGFLYLSIGNIVNTQNEKLITPISAFYFSLVTLTTLGFGDFVPKSDSSRFIVMLEVFTGIIFLLIVIPSIISRLTAQNGVIKNKEI